MQFAACLCNNRFLILHFHLLNHSSGAKLLEIVLFFIRSLSVVFLFSLVSISLRMVCLVSRTGRELQRYDNLGRRQVVGCIPYRFKCSNDGTTSNDLEVLVISSQKCQKMMFPKGGWELDESREEAALRESLEEAGVLGNVECELGKWDFLSKSHGTFYEGYMFPLLVKKELDFWPEQHVRQRAWMNVKEARDVCQHWWMKEALDILVERLSSSLEQQKEEDITICDLFQQ